MPTSYVLNSYLILGLITAAIVLRLIIEAFLHRRNLLKIPIRIHVNGTRGKSSVTRLIAAGLRSGGMICCAKTTGTLARFILPDGSEEPIYRASRPNVIEQIHIVRRALRYQPQALVIECMAVQPLLQSLSELKIVRSTHGVICNAREDHLDVMGPREIDVAFALAGTVPVRGQLFTAEVQHLPVFKMAADDRHSTLIAVTPEEISQIDDSIMSGFRYQEHKDNVALALRVCESLGISRRQALEGMWCSRPDPGAATIHEIDWGKHRLIFVNGFAANDPYSSAQLWHDVLKKFPHSKHRIALMNCREDRRQRSQQFAEACASWEPADQYVAIGTGTGDFIRTALQHGISQINLVDASHWDAKTLFMNLIRTDEHSPSLVENPLPLLIVGMGNIAGIGFDIVDYIHHYQSAKEII